MEKKSILVPIELVDELKTKMKKSYSGNIVDGFLFYLKRNIEILKKEEIIFDDVSEIKELKEGVIERGDFTKDIIKNAIMREPFQGKKKLIKALIIAAFNENWENVYNKYYNQDGDLVDSEILGKVIKKADLQKVIKTTTLKNWKASANFSTPQWANYIKIPIERGFVKRVKCKIITTSEYYRFGFKLSRENGKLFGDGSIQSMDNNFVIHYGKNFLSDKLFITTYHNGILQRPDKYTNAKPSNNRVVIELFIDNENLLYLFLNENEVFKFLINKKIRGQIYILAWADGNEFQMSVENIEIEYEIE